MVDTIFNKIEKGLELINYPRINFKKCENPDDLTYSSLTV